MSTDPFDTPAAPDPFDTPVLDERTGELLEPSASTPAADAAVVPVGIAAAAAQAVEAVDHEQVAAFTGDLAAALERRTSTAYQALVDRRPAGRVTAEVVAPELAWLADAHDVLAAIGKTFTDQARSIKSLAGDVVLEVRTDRDVEAAGGSASVRVGTPGRAGSAVKVTATQPTETFTDTAAIVDVLVPWLLDSSEDPTLAHQAVPDAYCDGARDMAATLLGLHGRVGLLAAPKWKSSALDVLRATLQGAGEVGVGLAARLAVAYGRRPKGNVQVTVERSNLTDADA